MWIPNFLGKDSFSQFYLAICLCYIENEVSLIISWRVNLWSLFLPQKKVAHLFLLITLLWFCYCSPLGFASPFKSYLSSIFKLSTSAHKNGQGPPYPEITSSDLATLVGHYTSLLHSLPNFSKRTNSAFTSCSHIHFLTPYNMASTTIPLLNHLLKGHRIFHMQQI